MQKVMCTCQAQGPRPTLVDLEDGVRVGLVGIGEAFEHYDFFIQPDGTMPNQLSWLRYGDLPPFLGPGKTIIHLVSWRVDSFDELPGTMKEWVKTDAPLWRELAAHCERVEFGLDGERDFTARWDGDAAGSDVELVTPAGSVTLRLPLPVRHNVMNALAAAAVAQLAGADLDAIRQGLASLAPVAGRYTIHRLPDGVTLIDDTYNPNPASL